MAGAVQCRQAIQQAIPSADRSPGAHGQPGAAEQGQGELYQIGEHHAAQAAEAGVAADDQQQHDDGQAFRGGAQRGAAGPHGLDDGHETGQPLVPLEKRRRHLHHGAQHPAEHHAILHQLQAGPAPAQRVRRATGVAQPDQLGVRYHPAAVPVSGKQDEYGGVHADDRNPQPVARQPFVGDDAGDRQRGIGGEGGGGHGSADPPPRQGASGQEVTGAVAAGAASERHPDAQGQRDVQADDQPVDGVQGEHGTAALFSMAGGAEIVLWFRLGKGQHSIRAIQAEHGLRGEMR